jgi:hypothetical protein
VRQSFGAASILYHITPNWPGLRQNLRDFSIITQHAVIGRNDGLGQLGVLFLQRLVIGDPSSILAQFDGLAQIAMSANQEIRKFCPRIEGPFEGGWKGRPGYKSFRFPAFDSLLGHLDLDGEASVVEEFCRKISDKPRFAQLGRLF